MAVTLGNTSTATQNFGTSVSVARPTGAATGSVIYLYFTGGQPPSSTPSGFTAVSGANVTSDFGYGWHVYTYYKVIADIGTEPANYTVNVGSQEYLDVVAVDVIGCDTTDPIGGTPTQNVGSGTTSTGLSVTADRDGSMLLHAAVSSTGARTSGPSGMTNKVTFDTNVYVDNLAVDTGATGNKTSVYSNQGWSVDMIVFQPAASTDNNAAIAETAAEFTEAASVSVEVAAAVAETAAEFTEAVGVSVEVDVSVAETAAEFTESISSTVEVDAAVAETAAEFTENIAAAHETSNASITETAAEFTESISGTVEVAAAVAETAAEFTEAVSGTVDIDVAIGETAAEFTEAIFSASMQLLLSASANGRYLQDQSGNPFFVHGEAAWSLIGVLDQTDAETYLDDRASRGLNFVLVNLIENNFSPDPPNNEAGQGPYTGTMFQSATNSSYWSFVDWFVQACADRGMVVFANPAYIGFNDSEGVGAEVNAASTGQMQTYGEFLGARYESYDNIVWCLYGDREAYGTKMDALQTGISNQDARHTLYAAHFGPNVSSSDAAPSWLTLNYLYSYESSQYTYEETEDGWDFSGPIPALLGEALYELENGATALTIRRQIYQSVLAGATGHIYGHRDIWGFGYGLFQSGSWQSALNDTGIVHAGRARDFFESISWHTLVPQHNGDTTLLTSGRGTFGDINWAVAGIDSGGTVGVVYRNDFGSSVTVDLSLFAGEITARWYDPTNGSYTADGASPLTNSGTHAFSRGSTNAAGDDDWVLLLEAVGDDNATIAETAAEFTEAVAGSVEVAASVAETAAEFTESVAGSVEVDTSVAETAAEFTESIGSTVVVAAAVAETAAEFTEAVAVSVEVSAAIAETAAEFTESLSVTGFTNASIAETAAEFTEAISSTVTVVAAIPETAAEFTESISGAVDVVAAVAETVAEFTESVSATGSTNAAVAETAAEFTEAIAGTVEIAASVSEIAAEFTESITATADVAAALVETAAEFTEAITVTGATTVTVSEATEEFTESVIASVEVAVSVAEVAAEFTESITTSVDVVVAVDETAAEFTESISSAVGVEAAVVETAAEFTEDISAIGASVALIAEVAAEFTESISGAVDIVAAIAETTAEFTESISGSVFVVATVSETVAEFTESISVSTGAAAVLTETAAEFVEAATVTVLVQSNLTEATDEFTESSTATVLVQADIVETAAEFTEAIAATGSNGVQVVETAAEFTEAIAGTVEIAVAVAETAAEFTESISGAVDIVTAVAETAAEFTEDISVIGASVALIAEVAAEFTESVSGTVEIAASVAETAAEFTESISSAVAVEAAIVETAAEFTEAILVFSSGSAVVTETAAEFTESVAAEVVVSAALAETLAEFTEAITGSAGATASLTETAAEFTEATTVEVVVSASVSETLAEFLESIGGSTEVATSVAETVAEFTEASVVEVVVSALVGETAAEFTEFINAANVYGTLDEVLEEFTEAVAVGVEVDAAVAETAAEFTEAISGEVAAANVFISTGRALGTSFLVWNYTQEGAGEISGDSTMSGDALRLRNAKGVAFGAAYLKEVSPLKIQGLSYMTALPEVLRVAVDTQTLRTFNWLESFEENLSIFVFEGNTRVSPAIVRYSLIYIRPNGSRKYVGPRYRTPVVTEVGAFHATGLAGEGGQPGDWVIEWVLQRSSVEPPLRAEMPFRIVDGTTDTNPQDLTDRKVKYGWD